MSGKPPQIESSRLPQTCSALAGGIALLALAGWLFNARILAGQWGSYIPMAPSTALAFLLLGAALFGATRWPVHRLSRLLSISASSITTLLGLLVFFQFLTGVDFGIEWALAHTNELIGGAPLGRMSPLTAVCLVLEGAALLLPPAAKHFRFALMVSAICSASAVTASVILLTGYISGAPLLYGGPLISVALPTALAFFSLGAGELAMIGPGVPALQGWRGATYRGRLLRAFLPPLLVLVLIEGWLEVKVQPLVPLSRSTWGALSLLALGVLVVAITGWTSRRRAMTLSRTGRTP